MFMSENTMWQGFGIISCKRLLAIARERDVLDADLVEAVDEEQAADGGVVDDHHLEVLHEGHGILRYVLLAVASTTAWPMRASEYWCSAAPISTAAFGMP